MNPLADMRVIVTGAASGIGRATAELLVQRQAHVMAVDLAADRVAETVSELNRLGGREVFGQHCDVRSAADCDRVVAEAERRFEQIDALVHCAGILRARDGRPGPLHEVSDEEFEAVIGTNLRGTLLVNRAVLRHMVGRKAGQVINLSSTSGRRGIANTAVYSASKAGVIALSEAAAEEVRPFGVRVQVILPDAVDTPLWKQNGPVPPPPGALPPARVAEVIALCLSLPADTICDNLVVSPLSARRMRGRGRQREESRDA